MQEPIAEYTQEEKMRAEKEFDLAVQSVQLQELLKQVKEEAKRLQNWVLTEREQEERKKLLQDFDTRVQSTAFYTFKNLEKYRIQGWKELIYDGDDKDEGIRFDPGQSDEAAKDTAFHD